MLYLKQITLINSFLCWSLNLIILEHAVTMCSKCVNLLFDYINKNTFFSFIPEFLAYEVTLNVQRMTSRFPGCSYTANVAGKVIT